MRWGFLGAGQMARALARGLVRAGVAQPDDLVAADPAPGADVAWTEATGAVLVPGNRLVAPAADVIVVAVKPPIVPVVLAEVRDQISDHHLVISIAAGVTLAGLRHGLGAERRIVRVMPNTPALIGQGAAGYCLGPGCRPEDDATVRRAFEAVGVAWPLPESLLDAVTGLSGSGPAFVYLIVEALSDGGVKAGLPRDVATALAAQTLVGAARMVLETGRHPGALKDEVTSPGGTTIAGLHALERGGLRGALIDAVEAATQRSRQLAAEAKDSS